MAERPTQEELIKASGLLEGKEGNQSAERYVNDLVLAIRTRIGSSGDAMIIKDEFKVLLYEFVDLGLGVELSKIIKGIRNNADLEAAIEAIYDIQEDNPEENLREIMKKYHMYLRENKRIGKIGYSASGKKHHSPTASQRRAEAYERNTRKYSTEVLAIGPRINLIISRIKTKKPPRRKFGGSWNQ